MKTLLLDAGNTRLKWALCEQGQLSRQDSLKYDWPSISTQLDATLGKLLTEVGPLAGVTMCNVAGEKFASALRALLSKHGRQHQSNDPLQEDALLTIKNVVAQADAFGVRCAYKQPAQLGADRWAALVAARHYCEGASCIIDCGSAMTVDVLTADGRHAGGVIIPGMEMMLASLLENTDGILASERPDLSPLAVTNTSEAVQAGIVAAMHGAVQQVLQQCADELGEKPACVLTGGNGKRLLSALPNSAIFEPDWVLKGLAIIAADDRF